MTVHLYFSLVPEALIASMLPPEKFGQYYATGHEYKSKGQSIFFEIDPTFAIPISRSTRRSPAVSPQPMVRPRTRSMCPSTVSWSTCR